MTSVHSLLKSVLLPLSLISSGSFAQDSETQQTSWFNGPGHTGPLSNWSQGWFSESSNMDYRSEEGYLSLAFDTCLVDSSLFTCSYLKAYDFDMDGDDDLFATTEHDSVLVWFENLNQGASWQKHIISDSTGTMYRLELADFFGDGAPELVTVCRSQGTLLMYQFDSGTWTVTVMDSLLSEPIGLCVADIDLDGLTDIVVTQREAGSWGGVSWYENTGTGSLEWTCNVISEAMTGPTTVYAADYDYDGDQDLSVVDLYGNAVFLCTNGYPADEWTIEMVAEFTYPEAAPFADIDGSGNMDIVVAELGSPSAGYSGALYRAQETSPGEWAVNPIDTEFHQVHWCGTADMDGDGDNDVYATNVESNSWCSWWENHSSGSQWIRHDIWFWGITGICSRKGRFMELADWDCDGEDEFAVTPYAYNSVTSPVLVVDPYSYSSQAWLESTILVTPVYSQWASLAWNADTPEGTSAGFQVREGDSPTAMGQWSETLFSPGGLEGVLTGNNRYFQYRAILQSFSPELTPVLEDVALIHYQTGVFENQDQEDPFLLLMQNPSAAILSFSVVMREPLPVDLCCYDIGGRVVWDPEQTELSAGSHRMTIQGLPPGMYLIRVETGAGTQVREVILLGE